MTARTVPTPLSRALLGVVALALAGCSGAGPPPPRLTSEPEPAISPVVRGAEAGLEARFWVVENSPGMLAGTLGRFSGPASGGAAAETWRANGLRVFAVPVEELDAVLGALPTIGPRHRQWMGLLPEWVEVLKGASLDRERVVVLDNGPVRLGPGRFRLAARCWVSPSIGALPESAGARMTLELMPEITMVDPRAPTQLERLMEGGSIAADRGRDVLAFERLKLSLDVTTGDAIVIVPEDPGADWSAPAERRPESELEPEAAPREYGPAFPSPPTLGELMLTNRALPDSLGDARIIVVLVPRVPERFELLSR